MEHNSNKNLNDSSFEYNDFEAMNNQQNSQVNLHGQSHEVKTWSKQEKIVIIGFGIVSALVLILGFLQFNSRRMMTYDNMFGDIPESSASREQLVGNSNNAILLQGGVDDTTDLRTVDTDKDGISDYDELNRYGTSPYLADSDSDGQDDKAEIAAGQNPNCPVGKDCGFVSSGNEESAGGIDFGLGNEKEKVDGLSSLEQGLLDGSLSGTQMRELLKEQGADDNLLNQISDEQLEELYKGSLGQIKDEGLINNDGTVNPAEAYSNLNPSQIRDLMVKAGTDRATVDGMSDEEINKIYQDTLSSLN